jgi:hypothetical protein
LGVEVGLGQMIAIDLLNRRLGLLVERDFPF